MSSRDYQRGYASRGDAHTYRDSGAVYYHGSAAPVLDPDLQEQRRDGQRRPSPQGPAIREVSRHHARKSERMNPLWVASMVGMVVLMSVFLFAYIGLQAKVTDAVEEIASLESELSTLRSDNDEALNAIESGISLDEIKYRAMADLGMTYAQEDQIITYSNDDTDYVRQVIQPD